MRFNVNLLVFDAGLDLFQRLIMEDVHFGPVAKIHLCMRSIANTLTAKKKQINFCSPRRICSKNDFSQLMHAALHVVHPVIAV